MNILKLLNKKNIFILTIIIFLIFIIFVIGKSLGKVSFEPKKLVNSDKELDYEIYFNYINENPVFINKVVERIDNTNSSIDIAIYSIDSERIISSLRKATDRGVKVRIVLGSQVNSQQEDLFKDFTKNIGIINLGKDTNVRQDMHQKFAIFDYGKANQSLIWGSWNWTEYQELYDPSYILFIQNEEIIDTFYDEFENYVNKRYGTEKLKQLEYNPFTLKVKYPDNGYIEVWFSPGQKKFSIYDKMYDLIDKSESEIIIANWFFTDKSLIELLNKKAKEGVKISILTDDFTNSSHDSVVKYIDSNKINLYLDTKYNDYINDPNMKDFNSFLHLHYIIIDNEIIAIGTNNWSKSSYYYNDESMLVSNNLKLIADFRNNFNKLVNINN